MKSTKFLLALCCLACIIQFTGCVPHAPKVGILLHSYENERWSKDKDYLVDELTKRGADVFLEVAENDQQKQISQAQSLIDKGVQVLIVVSVNQNESAKIVELAHEADVKVIAYDRLINGCKLDYYVTTNSTRVGELQASYLTSLKPKGKYALICGSKYDDNSMKLFLGQMHILQPFMERGEIQLVYSEFTNNWSPEEGSLHTSKILEQNSDSLTAIIAGSDAISIGVLKTLREKGLAGKVMVAGQDCELSSVQDILQGNQTCDILKPLKEMASISADLAVAIAQNKKPKMKFTNESNGKALVKSVLLEAIVVNKTNIESTVIASGFHNAADLKK
jgi:D-xylose transport system substrate-binding protein